MKISLIWPAVLGPKWPVLKIIKFLLGFRSNLKKFQFLKIFKISGKIAVKIWHLLSMFGSGLVLLVCSDRFLAHFSSKMGQHRGLRTSISGWFGLILDFMSKQVCSIRLEWYNFKFINLIKSKILNFSKNGWFLGHFGERLDFLVRSIFWSDQKIGQNFGLYY